MSSNGLNISCKKAAELMCRKEEKRISFWERIQLNFHLFICGVCKKFELQDRCVTKNISNLQQHCKGCLSEKDKQAILEKMS